MAFVKSKFINGRNLSHSPLTNFVRMVNAVEPKKYIAIGTETDAAVLRVITDSINANAEYTIMGIRSVKQDANAYKTAGILCAVPPDA